MNNYKSIKLFLGFIFCYYYISHFFDFQLVYGQFGILHKLQPLFISDAKFYSMYIVGLIISGIIFSILFIICKNILVVSVLLCANNILLFQANESFLNYGWTYLINYFLLLLGLYSRFKAAWVVTLFKIQIALIYFKASFHRINDPGWLNGDMLIFAAHSVYAKWPQVNWIEYEYLLKILSYLGWLLELFAPIGLFLRKFQTATITAILLIIFHIMLELLTNVGLWSYIMSTLLLVFIKRGHNEQ